MVSAELSIGFSAMLDTIHDDLPGRIVDFIEDAIVPDSEAIAFASDNLMDWCDRGFCSSV